MARCAGKKKHVDIFKVQSGYTTAVYFRNDIRKSALGLGLKTLLQSIENLANFCFVRAGLLLLRVAATRRH